MALSQCSTHTVAWIMTVMVHLLALVATSAAEAQDNPSAERRVLAKASAEESHSSSQLKRVKRDHLRGDSNSIVANNSAVTVEPGLLPMMML